MDTVSVSTRRLWRIGSISMTESNDNQDILVIFKDDLQSGSAGGSLTPPPTDDTQTQALWNRNSKVPVKAIAMNAGDLASELSRVSNALQGALDTPDPPKGKFRVESFEVGLAINASGKIALVAEIGMEASINVTFKRA